VSSPPVLPQAQFRLVSWCFQTSRFVRGNVSGGGRLDTVEDHGAVSAVRGEAEEGEGAVGVGAVSQAGARYRPVDESHGDRLTLMQPGLQANARPNP
jgi:hypothetical protein